MIQFRQLESYEQSRLQSAHHTNIAASDRRSSPKPSQHRFLSSPRHTAQTAYWTGNKYTARHKVIVGMYRTYFHRHSLPAHKQYITLAGMQTQGKDVAVLDGMSEFLQMTAHTGLVKNARAQYHGFDLNPELIALNRRAAPQANWCQKEIYSGLIRMDYEGKLDPGIVFFDSMRMPNAGVPEFARLMAFLTKFSGLLLVGNFILHRQFYDRKPSSCVFEVLAQQPEYAYAMSHGWDKTDKSYEYDGNHAKMAMVAFTKP